MRKFAAELFAVHLYEVIAFLCLLAPLLSLLICGDFRGARHEEKNSHVKYRAKS